MKKVRFGVVGVRGMGKSHATKIAQSGGKYCRLTAVADVVEETARDVAKGLKVTPFTSGEEMFDSGLCDAVVIATPHYWHAPLTIQAARAGLHVLCEKPLASTIGAAQAMVDECAKRKVAMGTMFQMRTRGIMKKAKQIVDSGKIGEVFRVQSIASTWFRTQEYFDSGAWRGTWDGEGGGVLINQAPHHLDLFQWFGGMPKRVMAVLSTRAHKIEVEDTANIICEYENGKIGYLYATTAEAPGYEQVMLSGDKGTMIIESGKIRLGMLKKPVKHHIMSSKKAWPGPKEQKTTWREVPYPKKDGGHIAVIRAFAAHILKGTPMVVSGREGLNELMLSNAAYISGYKHKTVELPVNAAEMDRLMTSLIRKRSTGRGGGMFAIAQRELKKLLRKS